MQEKNEKKKLCDLVCGRAHDSNPLVPNASLLLCTNPLCFLYVLVDSTSRHFHTNLQVFVRTAWGPPSPSCMLRLGPPTASTVNASLHGPTSRVRHALQANTRGSRGRHCRRNVHDPVPWTETSCNVHAQRCNTTPPVSLPNLSARSQAGII